MPEQTEPTPGAGDQQVRQPTAALPVTSEQQAQVAATPAQMKPTTRPAAKAKMPTDDRDDFIRNALPVAAALRRSGKPEEAKQLELVANAILQTKSMERTAAPMPEQTPGKEETIKDLLANVYKAIDQDPALRNMPEAKEMRRAGNKLDKDGMLNITVRNGVVTSFVSNFTDNFSRTQKPAEQKSASAVAPAPVTPVVEAPAPGVVVTPAPIAAQADDPQVKLATIRLTFNNPEEPGRGMPDVLSKRFQEAGASAEVLSTKPAPMAGQSISELQVSYRLDGPGIDKVSALLDAAAVMRGSKLQEMPGDPLARKEAASQEHERLAQQSRQQQQAQGEQQTKPQAREKVQQLVAQPAPLFQAYPAYTLFAPSTENGIIESRKAVPHDSQHLNVALSDKGEFGINPKVDQQRLIGDGIGSMSKFFDYALPTSGFKIAHVGLAEPGQMKQTETGWQVVTKGKLAITDTEGNVFKPQVGPAQQLAPTPAAIVAQVAPGPQPAPSKGEVLFTSGPPDLSGHIKPIIMSSHQAYYSIYQIQVDAHDPNRAILLPAPGADASIIAALDVSTSTAYQVPGSREAHEKFLAVQTPAQLVRTADGWKLTEKGAMSFSATESVYQAQQPTPVQQAPTVQQPAPSKGEVIYSAAPPMSNGVIRKDVLSSQAAHYSVFQIQVDPRDANRAILLPAPGADGRLINSLRDSMDNSYQVTGRPEVGKQFLAVQTPTQLERTADGWKVTEKGVIGFSAAESVYQAPQLAPVQQAAPPAGQQRAKGTGFTVADLPADILAKVGVPVTELERTGQLQKLLAGKKTDLIPDLLLAGPDGQPTRFAAKLVLDRDTQGVATLRVDLPKRELEIPQQVMGKQITPAMQEQLKTTGVVPLADGFRDGKGQTFAGYLAVDQEMKRVVAVRPEGITLPKEVYGAKLSPEQHKSLLEGKPTRVEGMTRPGEKQLVDALVQLDPLKRAFVFRDTTPRQVPEQVITQAQTPLTRRQGVRM